MFLIERERVDVGRCQRHTGAYDHCCLCESVAVRCHIHVFGGISYVCSVDWARGGIL